LSVLAQGFRGVVGEMRADRYNQGMCIICIELARGALRPNEARRALTEMRDGLPPGHADEVEHKVEEAEEQEASAKKP
jgi:hypothetical protein